MRRGCDQRGAAGGASADRGSERAGSFCRAGSRRRIGCEAAGSGRGPGEEIVGDWASLVAGVNEELEANQILAVRKRLGS